MQIQTFVFVVILFIILIVLLLGVYGTPFAPRKKTPPPTVKRDLVSNPPAYQEAVMNRKARLERDKQVAVDYIDREIRKGINIGQTSIVIFSIYGLKEDKLNANSCAYIASSVIYYPALKSAIKVFAKRGFRFKAKLPPPSTINDSFHHSGLPLCTGAALVVTVFWDNNLKGVKNETKRS